MRLGFDIDGVLSDFCTEYEKAIVELTGRNKFAPWELEDGPLSWDWPTTNFEYTKEEISAVWERIRNDPGFCLRQKPMPDMTIFRAWWRTKANWRNHDIYFITSRVGPFAKRATEEWLCRHLFIDTSSPRAEYPTVLIVRGKDKGAVCRGLQLDVMVEDNLDNMNTICGASPETKSYLISRTYNQVDTDDYDELPVQPSYTRIKSLGAFLPSL